MSDEQTSTAPLTMAIVGATGAVGSEIVRLLEERGQLALDALTLYASEDSDGETVEWETARAVRAWGTDSPPRFDLAFVAVPAHAAPPIVSALVQQGARVIDLANATEQAPVLIPAVNADRLDGHARVVAVPAGPVTPAALFLAALYELAIPELMVSTLLLPASSRGRKGMAALADQTIALLNQKEMPVKLFPQRLAFNVIPDDGGVHGFGAAAALEARYERELRQVLDEPELALHTTAALTPVFSGQALSLTARLDRPIALPAAREAIATGEGLELVDEPEAERYPMPGNVAELDAVQVGRMRLDASGRWLSAWLASDNLRSGSALVAVQIAEAWARQTRG